MPSDISRTSDDLRNHYQGVVMQQGRVVLDRDLNALQETVSEGITSRARDVIGPCGTPDDGFAISVPDEKAIYRSPPQALLGRLSHRHDFLIGPGTMYVGGQRAVLDPVYRDGQLAQYSYSDQPDWLTPPLPDNLASHEAVFLDLMEQEVGAVEDPDLLDVALGGPDTTQRLRLMRYIRRLSVKSSDCASAWAELIARWGRAGLELDPRTMRLLPQAALEVSFVKDEDGGGPCDPAAAGGYLGADNQLIRVQITSAATLFAPHRRQSARFVWGYDDASFMYRVTIPEGSDARATSRLKLDQTPVDAYHSPQRGQVVEILRATSILGTMRDQTDPLGQREITRCVAEPVGVFFELAEAYDPDAMTVVLDGVLPQDYASGRIPLFLRVWQAEISFDPTSGTPVALTDNINQGSSTGLQVAITIPDAAQQAGAQLPEGAFWRIAVRPRTPQAVYPERFLQEPQPPDGPRQWACPLAVIDWAVTADLSKDQPVVHDCRVHFDNLVELTRRRPGCCTVSIRPEDVTDDNPLQNLIDRAVMAGDRVTVCLGAGDYVLPAPLDLGFRHSNLTLESCGGAVTISADTQVEPHVFVDGLIVPVRASGITLRGLTLRPPAVPLLKALAAHFATRMSNRITMDQAEIVLARMLSMIGVRPVDSPALTIEDCEIILSLDQTSPPADYDLFAAGVFAVGNCSSLTIKGCRFISTEGPTLTPVGGGGLVPGGTSTGGQPSIVAGRGALTERIVPVSAAGRGAGGVASPPAAETAPASPPVLNVILSNIIERPLISLTDLQNEIELANRVIRVRQPMVTTFGLLADQYTGPKAEGVLLCRLGDFCLAENSFTGFSLAAACAAFMREARICGNSVSGSLGGFWLQFPDSALPSGAEARRLFTEAQTALMSSREALVVNSLGALYPLPDRYAASGQRVPIAASAALFITDNQVEAHGTAALRVFANRSISLARETSLLVETIHEVTASVVVANNRLNTSSQLERAPAALIAVPDQAQCNVTGNLIFNQPSQSGGPFPFPSLYIVPDGGDKDGNVSLLAVTGNSLMGPSNLPSLRRAGVPAPLNTWTYFNSILT